MRKYGLYLLIAVSLMTGCQKKDTVTVDTAAETTQESSETGSTAEREPESAVESMSGTDQNGDAQTDRFALIPIAVSGEYDALNGMTQTRLRSSHRAVTRSMYRGTDMMR